jgi:hypothetical protein
MCPSGLPDNAATRNWEPELNASLDGDVLGYASGSIATHRNIEE